MKLFLVFIISLVILNNFLIKCQDSNDETVPSDFQQGFFKFNDKKYEIYLMNMFTNKDNQNTENILLSYGDFNSDYFVDFVTVSYDNDEKPIIQLYISQTEDSSYDFSQLQIKVDSVGTIENIVSIDVNLDGMLDMIVYLQTQNDGLKLVPYIQQKDKASSTMTFEDDLFYSMYKIDLNSEVQPFIINSSNTNSGKLFIRQNPMLYENSSNERKYVELYQTSQSAFQKNFLNQNIENEENPEFSQRNLAELTGVHDFSELQSNSCSKKVTSFKKLASPNFSAIVDVSGDCRADIIVHSKDNNNNQYLEFWIYQENGQYCLELEKELKLAATSTLKGINYADFDFNGSTDIILLYENDQQQPQLQIQQNKYVAKVSSYCDQNNADWGYDNLESTNAITFDSYILPDLSSYGAGLFNTIRYGDINVDGYNDLILILESDGEMVPYILLNNADRDNLSFKVQKDNDMYNLNILKNNGYKNVLSASFFDINENGILDIFVNYYDQEENIVKFIALYNNIRNNNLHLKQAGENGNIDSNDKKVSTAFYGVTNACTVQSGTKNYVQQGQQLSQSAYTPLQQPYVIMGLGNTNSYVSNLKISYPQPDSSGSWYANYEQIIPNSQLLLNPYTESTSKWKIEVIINSTAAVLFVIIFVLGALSCLSCYIIYRHRQEKIQDKSDEIKFL